MDLLAAAEEAEEHVLKDPTQSIQSRIGSEEDNEAFAVFQFVEHGISGGWVNLSTPERTMGKEASIASDIYRTRPSVELQTTSFSLPLLSRPRTKKTDMASLPDG
jgi:hypothetical protein